MSWAPGPKFDPKSAPNRSNIGLRGGLGAPGMLKTSRDPSQDAPRTSRDPPRTPRDPPKRAPRASRDLPRSPPRPPRDAREPPGRLPGAPRDAPGSPPGALRDPPGLPRSPQDHPQTSGTPRDPSKIADLGRPKFQILNGFGGRFIENTPPKHLSDPRKLQI